MRALGSALLVPLSCARVHSPPATSASDGRVRASARTTPQRVRRLPRHRPTLTRHDAASTRSENVRVESTRGTNRSERVHRGGRSPHGKLQNYSDARTTTSCRRTPTFDCTAFAARHTSKYRTKIETKRSLYTLSQSREIFEVQVYIMQFVRRLPVAGLALPVIRLLRDDT